MFNDYNKMCPGQQKPATTISILLPMRVRSVHSLRRYILSQRSKRDQRRTEKARGSRQEVGPPQKNTSSNERPTKQNLELT